MSRTFRTLALSAALLATSTVSFAAGPGGTNPPPKGSIVSYFLSLFSF